MTVIMPRHEAIPIVLPSGWNHLKRFGDGDAWQYRNGLRVILSTAPMEDGREWLHVSISRQDRIPSYDDLKFVKNTFAPNLMGYQLFPPPDQNVNIHATCLHIYLPLDGSSVTPDFTMGSGSI